MSAQEIPNLLTMRGNGPVTRGGRRLRGPGGRVRGGFPKSQEQTRHQKDLDIQATDTDAAVSRCSIVDLSYIDDPYAHFFVEGPKTRRMPIINRGTYVRTMGLDRIIDAFLSHTNSESENPQRKQIISLGAGTDTRYFRLRVQNKHHNLIYHEFDFPSVSSTKERIVKKNGLFNNLIDEVIFNSNEDITDSEAIEAEWGLERTKEDITETAYCFHPIDLRQLPRLQTPLRGLRTDVPTLIISECCLCYLEVSASNEVLNYFTTRIPSMGLIVYEPIGVDDSFGQMMVSNLAARNITMPSLEVYKTLPDQKTRLSEFGFTDVNAETVEQIWEKWIDVQEKERVDGLEGLDEIEEWQMLATHYAIAWGWGGTEGWESLASL